MSPRLLRFLLSNANFAGCLAALVTLGLYLGGLIDTGWWALTAGAYAAAALAVGQPRAEHLPEGLSTLESLQWLKTQALPKLTGEAQAALGRILAVAEELMPRLKELEQAGAVQAQNRAMLKQTITRYLPDALESYLRLPSMYARTGRVAGEKTPHALLIEQLLTLESHVQEIREGVYSKDVDALLVNGRFLQEKFSQVLNLSR